MAAAHGLSGRSLGKANRSILRLVERLSQLGARPEDSHDALLRQGTLILVSLPIVAICAVWAVLYLALGHPEPALIPTACAVITGVGLIALSRTKHFEVFCNTQLLVYLTFPAVLQVMLGGFMAASGMILWGIFTPLAALALLGLRRSLWWFAAFLAELLVLAALDPVLTEHATSLPAGFVITFFVMNILGATVSSFVMLAYFVWQRDRAHSELEAERARSEALLLNVLPEPIAKRLKAGEGVIAERYDSVSVLFADLVGFTIRSTVMAPEDLVSLLDRIFTAFDRLVDAEGVEKIKTIGDAYMVAGGLPEPRPDHLQAVARIALAMREALDTIRQESGEEWISVRIGIDSGPAVAGVIGRRKFIYDLWGDTVNTASRMESHGVPGEIQITDRVAAALGAGFVTRQRGTIDVKGKGRMRTYFLDATSPAPSPDGLPARVKEGGQGQLQEEHAREGQPHSPEPA